MWFIRAIGRILGCDMLPMRYHEQTRRVREGSMAGLRSGFLIFSEKED